MIENAPDRRERCFPRAGWVVVWILLLCQVAICFIGRGRALGGQVDLRAFYAAGVIVRSGHGAQLYDYDYQDKVQLATVSPRSGALPFLYPAFAALPFVPLSLLSYKAAFLALLAANAGLLLLTALLLRPWLPCIRESGWGLLPALFACLFGVSVALMQGQISFVLLLIYSVTWIQLRRGHPVVAGLIMSLALMKFQIAIPIVLLFCVWKQWKFVTGFVLGGLALAATSLAMIGRAGAISYWRSMSGMTQQTALHADAARSHYGMFPVDMPNLHGLTFGLSHGATWGLVLNIVLCGIVLILAARQKPSLLVALPAAMLVSYHMQPHDLTLLLLPLSFAVDDLLWRYQQRKNGVRGAIRVYEIGLVVSLLLLILPLAGALMTIGLNYLVSFAVLGAMMAAAGLNLVESTPASASVK